MRFLVRMLLRIRWAYFHVSPAYTKLYVDEARTEAHFFHARTNSIHSNYTLRPPQDANQ
jgi:hypothetical protein